MGEDVKREDDGKTEYLYSEKAQKWGEKNASCIYAYRDATMTS